MRSHSALLFDTGHFNRLSRLITGNVVGGATDEATLYIEPTILKGCTADAPAMHDEIFGPILPIVNVASLDDAIAFVNDREKPLCLYVFSRSSAVCNAVAERTSSGAIVTNATLMHFAGPACSAWRPRARMMSGLLTPSGALRRWRVCALGRAGAGASRAESTLWRRRDVRHGRVPRQVVI